MSSASSDRTAAPSNDWVSRHYPRIHRAAWVMTGDAWEAEDLAQETFVVALDRWHRFEGRSADATWLYGILIRLNRRRKRSLVRLRRRLRLHFDHRRDGRETQDPNHLLCQQQWRESVWAEVARLPAAQRDAVTLRYAEGHSYEQIAAILGCPVGTAKTRVHHGIKQLTQKENLQPRDPPQTPIARPAVHAAHDGT